MGTSAWAMARSATPRAWPSTRALRTPRWLKTPFDGGGLGLVGGQQLGEGAVQIDEALGEGVAAEHQGAGGDGAEATLRTDLDDAVAGDAGAGVDAEDEHGVKLPRS